MRIKWRNVILFFLIAGVTIVIFRSPQPIRRFLSELSATASGKKWRATSEEQALIAL